MKDKLTKEQSQHLIDLGVPKEKATGRDIDIHLYPESTLIESAEWIGRFTLADIISILPKAVHKEGLAYDYNLEMLWQEDMKGWLTTYDAIGDNAGSVFEIELIDALYRLLCQTIENGYLKFE